MLVTFACRSTPAALTSTSMPTITPLPPTKTATPAPPTETPTPTLTNTPALTPVFAEQVDFPCEVVFTQHTISLDIFKLPCTGAAPLEGQITHSLLTGYGYAPHVSPNGEMISYIRHDFETELEKFWVVALNNENALREVSQEGVTVYGDYSWSPDSRYLVFNHYQADREDVDVVRLDVETGAMQNLTADFPGWDSDAQWSPTTDQIVFVSDRRGDGIGYDNIWVMDGDDSNLQPLTNSDAWENQGPAWSPDGKEVAFFRLSLISLATSGGGPEGLWIVNLESGKERLALRLDEVPGTLDAPAWSPDGKYIVYQSGVDPERDLYILSLEDGETWQISDLPGDEARVSWSPDSNYVMFTNLQSEGAGWRLYVVEVDGSNLQPLFDFEGNLFGEWVTVP